MESLPKNTPPTARLPPSLDRSPNAPQPEARLAKPVWISRCETKGCRGARHRVGKTQVSRARQCSGLDSTRRRLSLPKNTPPTARLPPSLLGHRMRPQQANSATPRGGVAELRSWKELESCPQKHTTHSSTTTKPDRSPNAPQPEARLAKPVWISRCETGGCRGARHRVGKTQVSRLIKTKA